MQKRCGFRALGTMGDNARDQGIIASGEPRRFHPRRACRMLRSMDWDDVRVFAAVARARSLATGARDARIDRSTAGRRITSLERAVGARLFLRTRDGLRLSAAGERLLEHADRMSEAARAFESSATETGAAVSGTVRLATTEMLGALLLRAGLLQLRARHPNLDLELLAGNRVVDLARGEAELALRIAPVKEQSLRVRRVASLSFGMVASESYLTRRGRPRNDDELEGHDVVMYGGELAPLPESRWLASRRGVQVVLRTNSMTALLAAVAEGAGLTAISGRFAEQQLGLVRLWDVTALPQRRLWLAMHPDAAARPAVRVVADQVTAILAGK
jgi:DNA-binding transcriptional LysR family regulator